VLNFHVFAPVLATEETLKLSMPLRVLTACFPTKKSPVFWINTVLCLLVTAELRRGIDRFVTALKLAFDEFERVVAGRTAAMLMFGK
jgi:hypothetical protein